MSEWTDEQVREMAEKRWRDAAERAATPALVPTPCVVSCQWEGYAAVEAEYERMEADLPCTRGATLWTPSST